MRRHDFGFWTDQLPYRWSHRITNFVFNLFGKLESHGNENIPKQGGALILCNHVSYFDPFIVGSAANRELYFMARHDSFEMPLIGPLIAAHNAYPVRRGTADRAALRHTISLLKSGNVVLIFPEGTRSVDGTLGKPHGGVSFIAQNADVAAIPAYIKGTILPRNAKWIHPAQLTVTFGTPIDFTEVRQIEDKRELYRQMGEQIMQEIANIRDRQMRK
ncbi:1-acyl-sn-glycerol-3-phosphate acyltransferase [Candidatus Poribacteria bacterium]|nr:1-acyl-sn-glycerol-3-phosphate acyltransferase [Candidatus Poribacteria bacterium]